MTRVAAYVHSGPASRSFTFPDVLTPDFAYVWGYFIGDGYLCSDKGQVGWVSSDEPHLDFICSILEENLTGLHLGRSLNNKIWRAEYSSPELRDLLLTLGFHQGAQNKTIPAFLLEEASLRRAVLQGLFDSDGTAYVLQSGIRPPRLRIKFTSTSSSLVNQVHVLLEEEGVPSRVYFRKRRLPRSSIGEVVLTSIKANTLFRNLIGFRLKRKQDILLNNDKLLIPKRRLRVVGDSHG